jgi:hypothetical protein
MLPRNIFEASFASRKYQSLGSEVPSMFSGTQEP